MTTEFSDFKNKTVLITGASSGIGRALALDLADRGAKLLINARREDALLELKTEIEAKGSEAEIFALDLSEAGAAKKLFDAVQKRGKPVDLLINNAGYGRWGGFETFEMTDYETMISLNITTLTELCYLFLPNMLDRKGTGIINVGSTASFAPVPYSAVYGATKAYVLPFTESLRYEYAPRGVRIMALCPGATNTEFASTALEKSASLTKRYKDDGKAFKDQAQTPEDVAAECLEAFLQDKQFIISGKANRKSLTLGKFMPRTKLLEITGARFKNIASE